MGPEEEVVKRGTGLEKERQTYRMPRTCTRGRWLGGGGGGGNGSVNDLSGWPADVTGWGRMAGDDSGGHVLRVDRR